MMADNYIKIELGRIFKVVVIWGYSISGQAVNSQLGPVRPTAEPSGQILASMVQAIGSGSFGVLIESCQIEKLRKAAKLTQRIYGTNNQAASFDILWK